MTALGEDHAGQGQILNTGGQGWGVLKGAFILLDVLAEADEGVKLQQVTSKCGALTQHIDALPPTDRPELTAAGQILADAASSNGRTIGPGRHAGALSREHWAQP